MDKYFEGTYRRTPQQNLAGASRNSDVSELINKVQNERKKREEARLLQDKARQIQSCYRSYVCRKCWKESLKREFVTKIQSIGVNNSWTIDDIGYLLQRMIFIYPEMPKFRNSFMPLTEISHLKNVLRLVDKLKAQLLEAISSERCWFWRIVYLLSFNFHLAKHLPRGHAESAIFILQCSVPFLDVEFYKSVLRDKSPLTTLSQVWEELLRRNEVVFHAVLDGLVNEVEELQLSLLKNLIRLINSSDNEAFRQFILRFIASSLMKPPKSCVDVFLDTINNSVEGFPLADLAQVYLECGKDHLTPQSLLRFLALDKDQTAIVPSKQKYYFELLSELLYQLCTLNFHKCKPIDSDPNVMCGIQLLDFSMCMNLSEVYLGTPQRAEVWIHYLNDVLEAGDSESLVKFCKCVYLRWIADKSPIYETRIIKMVAFHPSFLKALWKWILSEKRVSLNSNPPQSFGICNILAHGVAITPTEADRLLPALTMFSYFLKHHLAILNDDLFYEEDHHERPEFVQFRLEEIREIAGLLKDVAVGVISLAFPTFSFESNEPIELNCPTSDVDFNVVAWRSLLEELISLLRLVYIRDSRRQFTRDGFWITASGWISDLQDHWKPTNHTNFLEILTPFSTAKIRSQRSFNVYEDRYFATLSCLPFVIDFLKRFMLLQHLISESKAEYQSNLHLLHAYYVLAQIRRDYIYEDAYEKLSVDEVPEVRVQVKVHLISALGMEEAGVDGGGLFREFIIELLKTAFDPNRGFFLMNRDNELYPNPNIAWIMKDFKKHYSFIGRMLGKALYENILVEIPLAEFFLAKLLGTKYDLHLNGLASLDPDMYKNLMSILTYNGDFTDLGLDFTLSLDYFGTNRIVELKPNGAEIPVTKDNVLEYIHLVAKYKTHHQIAPQTEAFLEGLSNVIPLPWISMFSTKELQLIISGNETPIDIVDMRENVVYAGGYSETHPTIEMFWRVLTSFDRSQKSQLLKFVTSCSRPPLLGFKELYPPFCIQFVENDTMLPSASTCMNLLKLPNFQDENTMRQKILYAINSGSGFELT